MTEDGNAYVLMGIINRINEHIVQYQESLIKTLKDRPDDLKAIEIHESLIRELRSLLK